MFKSRCYVVVFVVGVDVVVVVVVVYLTTIPWGVSGLLGGDISASDSDPSVPRLSH